MPTNYGAWVIYFQIYSHQKINTWGTYAISNLIMNPTLELLLLAHMNPMLELLQWRLRRNLSRPSMDRNLSLRPWYIRRHTSSSFLNLSACYVASKQNSCQETRWKLCFDREMVLSDCKWFLNELNSYSKELQHKFPSSTSMLNLFSQLWGAVIVCS